MKQLLSIQAIRGIAVLGVVAFHSLSVERKYSGGDVLLPDFFSFGQSGVDLFFVISGFVMVTVTRGRFARSGEMMRFLWGRFSRIYPTYWFYFLLTAAILFLKPSWVNSSQGQQDQLVSSFLLLPGNQLPLVMVAWSLIHELWFYLVFAVLLLFHERLLLPSLLSWSAIIIVINLLFPAGDFSPAARIAFHPYSLEFIIGALVAIVISKNSVPHLSARHAGVLISLVLSVGIPAVYVLDIVRHEGLLRVGTMGSLYGLLVLSVMTLEKLNRLILPKSLQFIGDISYSVYLSHVLVLSAIGRLWLLASPVPESLQDNILAFVTMLAAVLSYGWLGYRMVEQPMLQLSHRLRARWFEGGSRNTLDPVVNTEAKR